MSPLLTKRMRISANFFQLMLGLGALLFGLMGYILGRPVDSTYLGSMISNLFGSIPFRINNYGTIGGVLPEFLHPFALALITMALFPQASRKVRAMICLFWLVVDLFFEIGQCFIMFFISIKWFNTIIWIFWLYAWGLYQHLLLMNLQLIKEV